MLTATRYIPAEEQDRKIFDAIVPADHYLRRVKEVIDFDRCRVDLATCYSVGLGRPALEPVLLLKLEFLAFHYGLADRELMKQAQVNMAFRYFLDLSLESALPHHTLMTKFRERLGTAKHQQVFDDIVAQARERGLVKDRLRLKDATHVIANIAIPSTVRLVAQTRARLLEAVRPYATERVASEEAQAASIHLTTADSSGEERLLQRVTHLRAVVLWVDELIAKLGPASAEDRPRQALAEALALAHKVLADREPKAEDKVVSVHDRTARWGKHGKPYVGYLLDVAEDADSQIITAVNMLPANGDEAADAVPLIQHEEEVHGNDVEALSMDGIGFRGTLLRECIDPEGLNLEVFVPPSPEPPTSLFRVELFVLDPTGETLTCPAGQTTSKRQAHQDGRGWNFRFARSTCSNCPLQKQCLKELPKRSGRTVFKSFYEKEYRAARAKAQTPEFAAVRRQHWRIERKLGEIVRWHGGRRARYRGHWRVLLQSLMTAVVVNVKRIVALTAQKVRAELAMPG
jgi:transposase